MKPMMIRHSLSSLSAVQLLLVPAYYLCCAAQVFAVPANPAPQEVVQPDGTKFTVILRGDEYQHWIETERGYSIVKNNKSGFWEYAAKNKKGDLVPSGKRVDPAKPPPKAIKPHLTPRRMNPLEVPVDKATMGKLNLQQSAGKPGAKPAVARNFIAGKWPRRYLPPSRNLLVILVGLADGALTTTATDWGNAIFNNGPNARSVSNYYKDNSYGKFSFVPVPHTQSGSPPGIVAVNIQQTHSDFGNDAGFMNIFNFSLTAAAQFVNFNALDVNSDGVFSNDELNVYFIFGGFEGSETTKTPSVFSKHSSVIPGTTLYDKIEVNGLKLREWSESGELNRNSNRLAIGTLVHELGHSLGLPDLYDTSYLYGNPVSNEGISIFSVMGQGNLGTDQPAPSDTYGSVPVSLDAWSREYLGWAQPTIPASCLNVTFGPALDSEGAAVKLTNPDINPDEYFLIENRYPKGWDLGLKYWDSSSNGTLTGGLLVLHIDSNIGSVGKNDINRFIATSHQGVMPVFACIPSYTGYVCRLFYSGNNSTFDETTTPNSNFYSTATPTQASLPTYMALRNVSAPSMTMTADVFPSYHLTVSAASPGSVIRNPIHEGDSYACSDVQLKAKPTYLFQNWSGDVTDTAANPIAVHVDAPKQVTALFASPYRPLPEFAMQNLVAACQIVGCPPFQVQDGKWIVNPSPNEKFKAISRGRDAKAKKATKIKKEVSQLAKKMGSASSSKQKKAEKRAGELVKELEQVGATN